MTPDGRFTNKRLDRRRGRGCSVCGGRRVVQPFVVRQDLYGVARHEAGRLGHYRGQSQPKVPAVSKL